MRRKARDTMTAAGERQETPARTGWTRRLFLGVLAALALAGTACIQTPEQAVDRLVSAARNGDADAFSGQLTGLSQAQFEIARAGNDFEAAVRTRFAGAPRADRPSVQEILNRFGSPSYEVVSREHLAGKRVELTIWRTSNTGGTRPAIQEQTWIAVRAGRGWKLEIPQKGLLEIDQRPGPGGTAVQVDVLVNPPVSDAEVAAETALLVQGAQFLTSLTAEVNGGQLATIDEVATKLNNGKPNLAGGGGGGGNAGPAGGTVVQGPGEFPIPDDSLVGVTDVTVPNDAWDIWWDLPWLSGTTFEEGVSGWADLCERLSNVPDGSLGSLVLSGHGAANGGVQSSGGDMDASTLPDECAELINAKLKDGARIIVLGCNQADANRGDGLQDLADQTGHPVVGNTGAVNSGTNGSGDWVEFTPN